MKFSHYLRSRSQDANFLWRLVIGILVGGVVISLLLDWTVPENALFQQIEEDGADSPRVLISEAAAERDWLRVWWLIPQNNWGRMPIWATGLAVATGLFWFLFTLQACQLGWVRSSRFWLAIAGLVLGILSVWPTLFWGQFQETLWGMSPPPPDNFQGTLFFHVVGVGLPEETFKFLAFSPLLLWLSRRKESDLTALAVATSVGLGFAAEENVTYIEYGTAATAVGRYLTANFFHMAATGLVGLAAFRALRYRKQYVQEAFAYFGGMVLAHGLYNTGATGAIIDGEMSGFINMIVLIGVAYLYFHELRSLRKPGRELISLSANFVVGVALLLSLTLIVLTLHVGFQVAIQVIGGTALSVAMLVYMFLREMPNTLVRT